MSKHVALWVNPNSGKGRGAARGAAVAAQLSRDGHQVVDVSDDTAEAAHDRAVAAVASGIEVLAVVGGDGMVHLGADVCAESDTALAVIAAGTGNDIATSLGLPLDDARAAAAVIEHGVERRIDLGRHVDDEGRPHWFAGVMAAGFDAIVNERANRWAWPRGQLRYNLAIVRELPVFHPIPYVIHIDGTRIDTRAMLVAVANAPSYGGGMRVCPDAEMDDGLLDVLIVRELSIPSLIRVFPRVFKGTHVEHPAVQIIRGRTITLEADAIMTYADGERYGPLPISCSVVPGALRVLVPAP